MQPPRLSFVMELRVTVGVPVEIGDVAHGRRRIVPILGGTFEGPSIRGRVVPGGADWQILRGDGVMELEARYVLETDSGRPVYVRNTGLRHAPPDVMQDLLAGRDVNPALVYFRTAPVFETAAPELQWLTRAVFVGEAERHPREVVLRVWQVE
jgi:hypothetical protein